MSDRHDDLRRFLRGAGLLTAEQDASFTPITGGVSSEIWKVDLPSSTVCVKRALPRLKVEAEWWAPVSRNRVERQWLSFAESVCPGQVPHVLAYDHEGGLFVMEYLAPERYPLWKAELLEGKIQASAAAAVGVLVARLHSRSAQDPGARSRFATDDNFDALRIEPYLRVTARAHPDLSEQFAELATRTATTRRAVVHGDVSPKNILLGPAGPVLLDAECAWFGDPAFDVAFCVNHLLLKSVALPQRATAFYGAADALVSGYARGLDWEPPDELAARAGSLLPALSLARVDGASPVEYLTEAQREQVRAIGRNLLGRPPTTLDGVLRRWAGLADGSASGAERVEVAYNHWPSIVCMRYCQATEH